MGYFRKKPVIVEAWPVDELNEAAKFNWGTLPECIQEAYNKGGFIFGAWVDHRRGIMIPTLEGPMFGAPGDWVVRGTEGEFYPCKPNAFEAAYEPASVVDDG